MGMKMFVGLAMILTASCGGGDDAPGAQASGTSEKVTLTFSSTGCAYDGPSQTDPGTVDVTLVNEVDQEAHVDLLSIGDGATFAELSAHVADERGRIESGTLPVGPPEYVTLVATVEAGEGATGSAEVDVNEGTIGFACIAFDGEQGTMYAAGPLEVTS